MRLKEIRWRDESYHNGRVRSWEGKLGQRIVGRIWGTEPTLRWESRLGRNQTIQRSTASTVEEAKLLIADSIERAIIKKFFQD